MSKLSQELQALLYLNQRYARSSCVSVREIAEYLEVSERQARRYMEDISLINGVIIKTKLGRDGGYRLEKPLDKSCAMPENIVLAMSIAMRRNARVEEVLTQLPSFVMIDAIEGDNQIDNDVMDRLCDIVEAISNQKELCIYYKNYTDPYVIQPYKVLLTNRTYYLYATHNEVIKKYDVRLISHIDRLASFKPKKEVLAKIESQLSRYGIKDNEEPATLRVRCDDANTLRLFQRYYEGKGTMDEENLIFEVVGNSEHELYYPLFRIGTKRYSFLDAQFRDNYVKYLQNQIRSITNGN